MYFFCKHVKDLNVGQVRRPSINFRLNKMNCCKKIFLLFISFVFIGKLSAQEDERSKKEKKTKKLIATEEIKSKDFLDFLMKEDTSQLIYKVLYNPRKYRLQIIYTQINRDRQNNPRFKNLWV